MRTTIGASRERLFLAAACASLACLPLSALAGDEAVIAGTVFRDPGFALPRAEVIVTAAGPDGRALKKSKPRKTVTDGRGEFAVYVPAVKSLYVVSARAEGLEPEQKSVELAGGPGERVDVYLTLKPSADARPKK